MNEDEYNATPAAAAARGWAWYMTSTISFIDMVCESLTRLIPSLEASDFIGSLTNAASNEQRRRWYNTSTHARNEINSDFQFSNALVLMAAWGAFEAFVEDTCRALLLMDQNLLSAAPFKNVKLTPSVLLLDDEARAEAILREAFK